MNWIFSSERDLPAGLEPVRVLGAAVELGANRLAEAAKVLGRDGASQAARQLGAYELAETLAAELRLAGISLGANGEFSALSPGRWDFHEEIPSLEQVQAGGRVEGIVLAPPQREELLRFLARNHVSVNAALGAEIARHYFSSETLTVAVRLKPSAL